MDFKSDNVEFTGSRGNQLAAKLEYDGTNPPLTYAIFAHCFTCTKDIQATRVIAKALVEQGFGVLRFDFAGLGKSEGDFADTNFSSNIEDIRGACKFLKQTYKPARLLIGHSLGGAAVVSAAPEMEEIDAVVTIGAPADAAHVSHNFAPQDIEEIEKAGVATVNLAGREFTIKKSFLDDLQSSSVTSQVAKLGKALLVMHSPIDATVGIENAQEIFVAARHPKSFVSLDKSNHLLSDPKDARFAADVIASWSKRYIRDDLNLDGQASTANAGDDPEPGIVNVAETGKSKFHNRISIGSLRMIADEPTSVGGTNEGPTPYGYLSAALGACTTMTLRMYADFKKIDLGKISVDVEHNKIHAADCETCTYDERSAGGKIDVFQRTITVEGALDEKLHAKVLEIADKCPVHKTLEKGAKVETKVIS